MKELKAGQWVKCIFNGVAEQQLLLEKNKWYQISGIENYRFFVNLGGENVLNLNYCIIDKLDNFVKFDLDNPLDYNPDEVKPKFKVGDKVKIIGRSAGNREVGNIGFIKCLGAPGTYEIITEGLIKINNSCGWFIRQEDLELIVEEHEEITWENIGAVLIHNGIKRHKEGSTMAPPFYNKSFGDSITITFNLPNGKRWSITEYSLNPKWLQHIEAQFGKLKPLPKNPEPKKEPTFEEALIELGFNKENSNCCHTKGRLAICTGRYKEIYIRKRRETTEAITYSTKEQLIKDIAEFEKKNRPHWSLVDDGGHGKEIGKIYRDNVEMPGNNIFVGCAIEKFIIKDFMKNFNYFPEQVFEKECSFGIVNRNDGSLIKAIWKGEE